MAQVAVTIRPSEENRIGVAIYGPGSCGSFYKLTADEARSLGHQLLTAAEEIAPQRIPKAA